MGKRFLVSPNTQELTAFFNVFPFFYMEVFSRRRLRHVSAQLTIKFAYFMHFLYCFVIS